MAPKTKQTFEVRLGAPPGRPSAQMLCCCRLVRRRRSHPPPQCDNNRSASRPKPQNTQPLPCQPPIHAQAQLASMEEAAAGIWPTLQDCPPAELLCAAASHGHASLARLLLHSGAAVDSAGQDGRSALVCAAGGGRTGNVQLLLQAGAAVDLECPAPASDDATLPETSCTTALLSAAAGGHAQCVRLLCRCGAAVNRQDTAAGESALHLAAAAGHSDVVRLLLRDFRATADLRDAAGRTPLMAAAEAGHSQAVQALLEGGAALNLQVGAATG